MARRKLPPNLSTMPYGEFTRTVNEELRRYGVSTSALTEVHRKQLHRGGYSIDAAYSIASDIEAGFTFNAALEAWNRKAA